MVSVMGQT